MTSAKDDAKRKSVLEDKEKFGKSEEADKLAHMGSKPDEKPGRSKASEPRKK
jgi:hypothetical protein